MFRKLGVIIGAALLVTAASADDKWPSTCNKKCQQEVEASLKTEQSQWVISNVTKDPFYKTPKNIEQLEPGDIVRWQDLINVQGVKEGMPSNMTWQIPEGTSLSRFMFVSEDENGKSIASTAFALLPFTNVNGSSSPMNTIAWSHGTSGIQRVCGPVNNNQLWYSWAGPFFLASSGFAVIAPDYSGLGSEIPGGFRYEAGRLHATDVSNSIKAARKHFKSNITHEWVSIGHSEGGMTAWRVNEREARPGNATGGFLGSVAVSPALRPLSLIPNAWKKANGGPVGDPEGIYFMEAVSRAYPKEFPRDDYITEDMKKALAIADKGCLITGSPLFANMSVKDMYKNSSWIDLPIVKEYEEKLNMPGPWPLAGPLLAVQGTGDTLTYGKDTEQDFNKTCGKYSDSRAELLLYPGQDHMPTMYASWGQIIPWIWDRFNGKEVPKGCKTRTIGASVQPGPVKN
ncbi:hypothetical protein AAP_03071 [Ascosphaera apis ARSEF 7405]|uniref:AB hydrolase-1 domain-containing protein n=1 Tax=Ascosphaera apis ARSEF 7405 TaxID=392613 RepID=A0A167YWP9_9EURO|nr:hypothetical protein AAP_03071 [Ascosphaera apis ARSEF 7405]